MRRSLRRRATRRAAHDDAGPLRLFGAMLGAFLLLSGLLLVIFAGGSPAWSQDVRDEQPSMEEAVRAALRQTQRADEAIATQDFGSARQHLRAARLQLEYALQPERAVSKETD